MKIVVVVDNVAYGKLLPCWGTSLLIDDGSRRILVDTGPSFEILTNNLRELGYEVSDINAAIVTTGLKHHFGASEELERQGVTVYAHKAINCHASKRFEPPFTLGSVIVPGCVGSRVVECPVVIDAGGYKALIVPCCYNPLRKLVDAAKACGTSKFRVVVGGFHTSAVDKFGLSEIVSIMREVGASKVYPVHCTAPQARSYIAGKFRVFESPHAGTVIRL